MYTVYICKAKKSFSRSSADDATTFCSTASDTLLITELLHVKLQQRNLFLHHVQVVPQLEKLSPS